MDWGLGFFKDFGDWGLKVMVFVEFYGWVEGLSFVEFLWVV